MTDRLQSRPSVSDTLDFARERHSRHTDRSGRSYAHHVDGVFVNTVSILSLFGGLMSEAERGETLHLSLLHDIVEETVHTGVSEEMLLGLGYAPRTVAWVGRLSVRPPGLTYQENIAALIAERVWPVIVVKAGDTENNLDPGRIALLPPDRQSIRTRYERSLLALVGAIEDHTGSGYPLGLGRSLREKVRPTKA